MGTSLAIFFLINNFRDSVSGVHKGEKPNNSFPELPSENF